MQSLYRRHRPRTFDEVVGQEHVVRTLRGAIEREQVHHAYLFSGSRGTGKTSMAKLLACALNWSGGPSADFDPEDPVCRAIMAGSSLDVVEMDAASNNSVDDVRELRDQVVLAPIGSGRRVWILDEAHMLSTPAWNAFLKTLEEPPPHVVFVFATTERHRFPDTILDRCHVFDFQRPTVTQLAEVLGRVATKEGIDLPAAAASLIARGATGSFRDALGTLEQLVAYGSGEVALDDVLAVLGVADQELIGQVADALGGRDKRAVLLAVERLAESGRDYTRFIDDLTEHMRRLLVIRTLGETPASFAAGAEEEQRLATQAEQLGDAELTRAIDLLSAARKLVRDGAEPRIQLEIALLKAAEPAADASMRALIARLERLEGGGGGRAAAPQAPSSEAVPDPPQAEAAPRAVEARAAGGGGPAATAAVARAEPEPEPEPEPGAQLDLEHMRALWPAVVDLLSESEPLIAAVVGEAAPVAVAEGRVVVAFGPNGEFARKQAAGRLETIAEAVRSVSGVALGVELTVADEAPAGVPAARLLGEDELLERAKAVFDGSTELTDETEPE